MLTAACTELDTVHYSHVSDIISSSVCTPLIHVRSSMRSSYASIPRYARTLTFQSQSPYIVFRAAKRQRHTHGADVSRTIPETFTAYKQSPGKSYLERDYPIKDASETDYHLSRHHICPCLLYTSVLNHKKTLIVYSLMPIIRTP